ncbi:NADH-quinone oxidoreductase chain M [Acetobacter estunensis NRIC 0472]|uniref:NADH-quinone oxidoreductase subunit M n=1 Tax=Acetobacter estunensis TaxID=104097 RepID=A0A967BAX4_9PROT|nr:NADH-quinone oxidoreductase subunit M [Acetobacter estunensis]NHO53688.1 NADH-quinone oxidoreductase subunit M [Acetobacter estunensis]GBQ25235.1 NADH-quinone oxidoreductase chain M [Acetobacter estunensis NRIC 0472]
MHPFLLSLVTYLPLLGGLAILLFRGAPDTADRTSRWIALWTSLLTLALSVVIWAGFDPQMPGIQYEQQLAWMPSFGISYHTGLDGISLVFVLLTAFLTPLSIGAAWKSVTGRAGDFMAAVLFLETALMGLFSACDLLVFYLFYEATLIPASLMIGVWGGPKRVWASLQFFLFTFGGSLAMLVAMAAMWSMAGTTDIPTLMQSHFSYAVECWLLVAFILAFGVKLPLFPLHAWLPDAYTEAPTATSALLSGVLSKTGAYGLLRFGVLMFPDAVHAFAPFILPLGVIAIIYAAFIAFAQTDMKRLVAYSSFSHMGMIAVGLFTLDAEGVDGAIYQMLSHGVVISALFFCVAAIAWRTQTRDIASMGGVAFKMPTLATLAMLFTMANIGLPGTGSFVGELLVLMGAIHVSFWLALLAGTTMIMGAVYMLALYRRVIFGAVKNTVSLLRDLSGPEIAVLAPLAIVTLWMGIHPDTFIRLFDPVVVHALGPTNPATALHAGTAHHLLALR